ncbi:uncharacterized protein LOC131938275 [Physella acuta]|uniref:uncharacterized protein LOC131938275 n=1 Tax=Physella acuta TaxID=109671 RepID=UPI0027DAD5D1|nr:uncharacterized protein LOC131938275 [Physella acuta]
MGPPDYSKIAIGVSAATGIVLVSFLLLKKFGYKDKPSKPTRKNISGDETETKFVGDNAEFDSQPDNEPEEAEQFLADISEESKQLSDFHEGTCEEAGQNQHSFIVLDNERVELPDSINKHKKSDRSSDESSYDVIDDDRLGETADEVAGAEEEEKGDINNQAVFDAGKEEEISSERLEENLTDPIETSMVVIEESNQNCSETSGLSLFPNSGESLFASGEASAILSGEMLDMKEIVEDPPSEDEIVKEDVYILDAEQTLLYSSFEGKNESNVGDGEADLSVVSGEPAEVDDSKEPSTEVETSEAAKLDPPVQEAVQSLETIESSVPVANVESVEISKVLDKCQNSPMNVTKAEIFSLVDQLRQDSPVLQGTVLDSLVRIAAFTQNINSIRESGCPSEITRQIQKYCKSFADGDSGTETLLVSTSQVLTNLSMDPKTQQELGDSVPALIDLLLHDNLNDNIRLNALRPLINLSTENTYQDSYKRFIPTLFAMLDSGSHMVKVQSLKVLVNLSVNEELVPYLLAAKAPEKLLELLDRPSQNDVILRAVTMLANIHSVIDQNKLTAISLPVDEKVESPETLFMKLTGLDLVSNLRSKVFRLTRHDDEDICYQASKLYKYIAEPST